MFTIMLRCGLRVQEVADLTKDAIDVQTRRLVVRSGKGSKGRVTYLSDDANQALQRYLQQRSPLRIKKVFLVEKGDIRSGYQETDGVLCKKVRSEDILPSATSYDGDAAAERRYRFGGHPITPWA